MNPKHALFVLVPLLFPLASTAQDKCTDMGRAEQVRIEKEFSAQRPARGDKDAEQAWSKHLHAALAAAAKRVEDCTRANKPAVPAAVAARIEECLAGVRRRGDELERRYRGRTLTLQEQTIRRGEEERLQDEYMSCTKRTTR